MNKQRVNIQKNIYQLNIKELKKALSDFIEEKEGFSGDIINIELSDEHASVEILVNEKFEEVQNV